MSPMPPDERLEATLEILQSKRVAELVSAAAGAPEDPGDLGWDSPSGFDAIDCLPPREALMTRALPAVASGLVRQGWGVSVSAGKIAFDRPQPLQGNAVAEKARLRAQKLTERAEQLRTPSVRAFVNSMERRRLHRGKFISIFSLMRDG